MEGMRTFATKIGEKKIVDAHLRGYVFVCVMYVLRKRERRRQRETETTLQASRIKLFSNLRTANIPYCKKCFQALPDVDVSFFLLL